MNQILSTDNNYKKKKTQSNELIDMRKIIIVFSILIIIFALVIVCAKIYGFIKEAKSNAENPINVLNKPNIEISKVEGKCSISVKYDEGISKITYWWNNDEIITEKNMNGGIDFITSTPIPDGNSNILHVKATGVDGSVNEITKEFILEGTEEDSNKPQIEWYYQAGQIEIVARSSKGIANLTYQWEEDEEITVNSTEENQQELRVTIDAKRGNNNICITATDLEGNIQTKENYIIGVIEPDIQMVIDRGNILMIDIEHDKGFKQIIIKINDQQLVYDETNPEYKSTTTYLSTSVELPAGDYNVEITVYTLEEPDKAYTKYGHTVIEE